MADWPGHYQVLLWLSLSVKKGFNLESLIFLFCVQLFLLNFTFKQSTIVIWSYLLNHDHTLWKIHKEIFESKPSSEINYFPTKKKFFKQKSFILIKMLISSKLLIWHLSRRIVRIESVGKGAAVEKSWAVIGWERVNERASFVYNL